SHAGWRAFRVADRFRLGRVPRHAETPQQPRVELDPFGVDGGIVRPDCLDGELPVLAVAALLGTVVPPHLSDRVQLLGLRLAMEAVLYVRAADRRCRLGSERQ